MDEIKPITENRLRFLAADKKFSLYYLEKDYYLTALLYFLRDVPALCFKGGTALNKIFLNHKRLSEDLDFTCTGSLQKAKQSIREIAESHNEFFTGTQFDKQTQNFFRLKISYKTITDLRPEIVVDVNKQASVYLKPQKYAIPHFYDEIPVFEVSTLNKKELIAEKVRTLFQRKKARDYFDLYSIIQEKIPIDLPLVRKKLKDVNQKFVVGQIFKNANKVYRSWEPEISALTNNPIEYKTMILAIAKHFKYREKKKPAKP
jgi:predicted nucleotidyltransferase component of viral defense system